MYFVEESASKLEICLTASCPSPFRIQSALTMTTETAKAGSDYLDQSLSVTFDVGEKEGCTTVNIINDVIPEERESFQIDIMQDGDYDIVDPEHVTIVIIDQDSKSPNIE